MMIRSALAILAVAGVAGCMQPEPVTEGPDGRALVSPAEATAFFSRYCYNSPKGTAARKSGEFQANATVLEGSYSAKHKTKSADIVTLDVVGRASCSLSFVGTAPAVESASAAAAMLAASLKAKGVNGKKGGGQVSFATDKGTVIVGNGSKRHRHGFSILFLAKK